MDAFQILSIITCFTSTITAIVVCVSLLPHMKDGMVIIRDIVLWLAFIALLSALGWLGFEHFQNTRPTVSPDPTPTSQPESFYAGR